MRHIWIASCLAAILLGGQAIAADQEKRAEVAKKKAEVLEQIVATEGSEASPPASVERITQPGVQAVDPVGEAPLDDAITCLSRTIYWEAKGESVADMESVASVVMNRLGHEGFPRTVCEVVTEGSERGACQFSWWCDGRSDQVQEEEPYTAAKEIARKALNRQLTDRTGGALFFHDRSVSPRWVSGYIKTAEAGAFIFYKPR